MNLIALGSRVFLIFFGNNCTLMDLLLLQYYILSSEHGKITIGGRI